MKKRKALTVAGVSLAAFLLTEAAQAGITGVPLGTAAPPSMLNGWSMTPFSADLVNPVYPSSYLDVTSVPAPGGTSLTFSQPLTHGKVGDVSTGWATWGQGYTGDVYDNIGASELPPTSVTVNLPAGAHAFYLYAEPAAFDVFTITATTEDGTVVTQSVNGNAGAAGFGFYTDTASFISKVRIDGADTDFGIGEFGINLSVIPEPSSVIAGALLVLPLALQGIRCLRKSAPRQSN